MKQNRFIRDLLVSLSHNWHNNHEGNFDFSRYGYPERDVVDGSHTFIEIAKYIDELERFYHLLEDKNSQNIFIQVLSFRILGHKKIKLPLSTPYYWRAIQMLEMLADKNRFIEATFPESGKIRLYYMDLNSLNIPVKLFNTPSGVFNQFFIRQYEYTVNRNLIIKPKAGDTIIDAGVCWGDSMLYFANQVGRGGMVYAVEFIPGNLSILKKNAKLNPELRDRIRIIEKPLWNTSGIDMYYKDYGPGSRVKLQPFMDMEGVVYSISIDDLVRNEKLDRVDFIKMDIEGSEQKALRGAINTLKEFKPNLAISIYHNFGEDFAIIANMLDALNLGYKFYLGHYTIHHEETVLFATARGIL